MSRSSGGCSATRAPAVDISTLDFWGRHFDERDEAFAHLRTHDPVSWHPPLEFPDYPDHGEQGFWAVTRVDDIRAVSIDYQTYSSARSFTLRPMLPNDVLPPTFMMMDPPEQTQYRRIMASMFTFRAIGRIQDKIVERARSIIQQVPTSGEFDFVAHVSARLPMLMIADFVGVPASLTEEFARAGDNVVSMYDTGVLPPGQTIRDFRRAQVDVLTEIGVDLVEHRRTHPAHDVATALADAQLQGRPLTKDEIGSMMLLLSIAGNDTTKQTTSHTVLELARNPAQRAWLAEDFPGRIDEAVDEFLRHASPVMNFARIATRDTELAGVPIAAGDKVALFYCSGNRDESYFPDPAAFDLQRKPTQHVAFGGGGPHHCLGSSLAKAQLKAIFEEIVMRLPEIEAAGEPEYLRSHFINGIRELPVRIG